jgi:hypothetical protein
MRIFPYMTWWYCSNHPTTPGPATPRYGYICTSAGCSARRPGCIADWSERGRAQRKKPSRNHYRCIGNTKHQTAASLRRTIDGMTFGLVSLLASVVYWLSAWCVDVYSYWAFGFCVSGLLAFGVGCRGPTWWEYRYRWFYESHRVGGPRRFTF